MIIVFLLLFRSSAQSDDYDVRKANQFLHKLPSSQIERLFTVGPLEKEVRLDFDADSREKMHNEVRRSVPEVRLEGHEDRTIPLNELTRMKKRFIRSAGSAFDQPVYDFMIPAGQQENSSLMAVLKFSTPDTAVVRFSVQMDRYKWFEITEVKRTQIGGKYEYEVPLSQAPNVDIEPERTKNSVYKFMVEAKQGKEVYNSRVRVEILSFSPTAEKVKATIEGMSNETTTVGEVEGSLEEPLDLSIGSDLPLTITATTDKSTEMNQETTEMVRSSSSQVAKEELEGSGEEPNRERTSLEQEEEDPLSEVVTVSTLIQQKETIKGNEINVTGTHEGVFDVDTPLNRGDLIRGLVISATSKSEATSWLNISIDRPELFSVRPRRIESGGKAYLFCNHPELIGDVEVKIMVSDGPVAEEQVVKIKYNRPTEDHLSSMALDFTVPEDAPSGTIIGRIANGTDMKVVGKSGLFALIGNNLLLSCPSENPCLDYETQHVHYLLLLSKDGSLYTTKVFIQVEDRNDNSARIETTDHVLRLSDGQLLMPFAIQILDEDTPSTQQNELSTAGDASDFLQLDKIDVDLYQVQVRGSPPPPGRYELVLRVDDGVHHSKKTHKTVKVLVQNSHSHAHFRRETRYERNMTPEEIVEGEEMLRVELEGLPIDEAKFVILSGNPGWLKIDDYGGAVRFSEAYSIPVAGRYETVVAVLSRKTGLILTQTVVTTVLVTNKEKKVFERELYEKTIDREAELIEFVLETGSPLDIDRSTIMAIDENGMQQQVEQGVISIHGDKIIVDKKSAAKLRVVRMEIRSGMEKAIVVLSLVSSNSFLDQKRRMASKPVFPAVPDVLEVVEELPIGHVLVTVPAVDPETGNSLSVIKRDDGQGLFALDPATGALTVTKRMDYDTSTVNKEIGLTFESGDGNYKTVTKMLVRLVDSDDNPPQINRESLPGKIVVPENIPVNTVILRVPVIDLDETSMKEGLVVTLSGTSKTLFKTMITNRTLVVQVAKELDRETKELHVLHLTVEDHAAHKDSITVNIELSDVNDSTPKFTREVYDVQAVEDWPAGVTLETVRAVDADSMERGQVVYSLLAHNSRHFTINKTSGELQVSQDLMGLAREEPYVLTAVATDKGVPVLNTTVPIRITVSEPRKHSNALISFISPPLGHVLTLNRELSPNEKIYQTKARIDGDGRNLKYSLKELLTAESLFDIDEMTGEVIVKKPLKHKEDHCHVESGYLSALSLSPTSCERLTPRALQRAKIRKTSQETIVAKSEGYPSPPPQVYNDRKAVSQLLTSEDDVERFMRGWVYKTKYVTTVFEAKGGHLTDLIEDATEEISRWLERRRLLVAAVEVHFSVPEEKKSRKDQQRLKTSLLAALVNNNQRILNLRRGRTLAPIQLVESRTEEKIEKDRGWVQGVYLKAYGKLLRYSHWETPEWHSPYWKLSSDGTRPRPTAFLWSTDTESLQNTALLLLTARTLLSGLEESRLLRIRYSPFSRPDPVFPHGKPLYFPFRKQNVLGSVHITVEEIGAVFYYLIPSCSPSTGMFSLNATSGELSHIGLGSPKNARIELCILATRQPLSETASLVYNSQKTNNILVDIVTEDEEHSPPDLQSINNTITVLDRKMSTVRLEMDDTALVSSFNFSIGNISFIPSESVLPLTTAAPLASLFTISRGGIVRPSSSLSSQPAGVYTVHVQSTNQQGLFQEFHLIPPSARLRFIFDKQLITVAKEFSAFEKELKSTVSQSTDSTSRLFLDQPKRLPANTSRSSICFHAVGVDTLLSAQTTIKSLSKNGDLLQVYNKFGVVDIVANCEDSKVVVETMAVALSSPTSLIAVSVLAFSSLIFFMIFVYFCFVRRYRDYLRLKGKALKEAPPVVPPTPTFVLSPPNSSPHFGYWE